MQVWKNSLRKFKFYKIEGNSFYFTTKSQEVKFNIKDNTIIIDGKTFAITKDNFIVLLGKVNKSLACVLDDDGATTIEGDNAKLLYKRKNKTEYCFLIAKEGKVLYYQEQLSDFIKIFNFESLEFSKDTFFSKQAVLPFYQSAKENGDRYAVCLINYLSNSATKEDVDFLNQYENNER